MSKNVCFTTYTYFICLIESLLTVHRLLDVVYTELSLSLCAGDSAQLVCFLSGSRWELTPKILLFNSFSGDSFLDS